MNDAINITEHLRSLEERLLQPSVRKNSEQVAELLADDFQGFGSSGRVFDKSTTIAELREESPRQLSLNNFQTFHLSLNIVLVTYISTSVIGVHMTQALRSSIWVRKDGGWKIRFHQGTRQG